MSIPADETTVDDREAHWLVQAVEAAAGRVAVEKQLNILGDYTIRYGDGIAGPGLVSLTHNQLDYGDLRIGGSHEVPASLSPSLLVGELFEAHAEGLLTALEIDGIAVESVRPLREAPRQRGGSRIDDWLLELAGGRKVPAEVKATQREAASAWRRQMEHRTQAEPAATAS